MTSNEAVQAGPTIPDTMRAAVLRDHDKGLEIETIRTPRPKTGEVLIKVAACGLCHSDLHVIGGAIAFPLPAVLGHEVTGTIVEVGPGNEHTGLEVGQNVAGGFLMPCGQCEACAAGRDELCGPFFDLNRLKGVLYDGTTRLATPDGEPVAMYSMGGLAEYAVVPSTAVAPVPDSIDMVPAAILGCAAMTGYGAVRRGADLRYGETVAVVATGGVGTNIVQIARAFGASQVIAIDVDDDKLAPMLDYGATAVVNSVTQDAREEVFRLTGGKGVTSPSRRWASPPPGPPPWTSWPTAAAWFRSVWGPVCRPPEWRSTAPCAARSRSSAPTGRALARTCRLLSTWPTRASSTTAMSSRAACRWRRPAPATPRCATARSRGVPSSTCRCDPRRSAPVVGA